MLDWAGGTENRNYAIRREIDARHLLDLLLISLSLGMMAGVFLFHSWVHAEMVATGYKVQNLQAEERALVNDQAKLTLEEQTLMSPDRIDAIAQADLGMKPPRPSHARRAESIVIRMYSPVANGSARHQPPTHDECRSPPGGAGM